MDGKGGVGGKLKVGYIIHWNRVDVSSMKHRNSHSVATCQAKMVDGSSLTPHAALSVYPTPVVDRYKFTGSEKCCM